MVLTWAVNMITSAPGRRYTQPTMKKTITETQTLRAGCSKEEPKIITPSPTPFSAARYG